MPQPWLESTLRFSFKIWKKSPYIKKNEMKALFQLFENLRCCCFLRELACTADPLSPIQLGVHIDHVQRVTEQGSKHSHGKNCVLETCENKELTTTG